MNTSQTSKSFFHIRASLYRASVFVLLSLAFSALLASAAGAQSGRSQQGRPGGGGGGSSGVTVQSSKRGQSTVSGRVVYAETGEPVRGARVRISARDGSGPAGATVTNDRGEFRFDNLAAGEYYVIATPRDAAMVGAATFSLPLPTGDPQADDAAFEAARRENSNSTGSAATVSVDGTSDATVEVSVARQPARSGGRISGRILYEDGKPAANAQVTFLNRKEIRGRMIGPTRLSVIADKRGFYQIGGMPPGDYIVSARLQEPTIIDKQGKIISIGPVSLNYYPSAASARTATPVNVVVDQETSDVNITLVKRSNHTISGSLVSRVSSRPLANVHIRLRNRDDMDLPFSTGSDDRFILTDAQGRFTFSNVMDGDYVISFGGATSPAMSPRGISMAQGPTRMGLPPRMRDMPQIQDRFPREAVQGLIEQQQEVTISGADVTNLRIEVSEGGRVSGQIIIEGDGELPPRIMIASEMKPGERRPGALARVNPDKTFTMTGIPEGPLSLDVLISPPGRFYIKAITATGVDLMREPLMISDGAEIRDVHIVLSSEVAMLAGRVLSTDGRPLGGATVLLAPADQNGQRLSRGRLIGVTNADGQFRIGAAPGEYRAVIWKGLPPSDEEALRRLAERAQSVTLRAGERQDIELVAPGER